MTEVDATPTSARALAPDLARGAMLLLIALANVHLWTYGHPLGPRGYPRDLPGADQVVALVQMVLVDGRAYPMFGLLLGYGTGQLARRRAAGGEAPDATVSLVRRRGAWMLVIGLVHGVLLWSGDIVGAYGLLGVLLAGLLVRGSERALLRVAVVGTVLTGLFYAGSGFTLPGDPQAFLFSMSVADPGAALVSRATEWLTIGLLLQAFGVFGAVALGAWAARRGFLDDPARHRPLLRRTAVVGVALAVVGGLPLALMAAQLWTSPPLAAVAVAGTLHTLGGYAGGVGYAAAFGLLAVRAGSGGGRFVRALRSCGQRSLSCYLAQSVAFAALLPAWTLGLGGKAHLWQTALLGAGVWLVVLVVAAATARAGHRGPAEVLLRRLTYRNRAVSRT
ncbi:DUF418 domain-containing protein [Pseudonocardia sp. KRD-184]|uniref:DUF418 domain-containing protein n=1 Tax=Pseudonocardia oceani TaxID=2792013 RepID=A0ABS6UFT6_9PSEU|nr:DUF418 domain-containing protein [Pseudonocardia oceani]MBW0091862.1 DUF418 domain-containing protein [Pseudonocardia oceani]MBW0099005.1 DUF418 domain-containing protein [Pseudonocardia oceani]MBW0111494.1 DUF418 domain-containing protein [Pseudonocardia oceani]MBW0125218.1 DUF418 domain-containing protein [Pseudonocardia oceani]MBW0131091.1 DUF418 domain-containing protein [Pseudonocardia oceani]